jgi:hypothetical protein
MAVDTSRRLGTIVFSIHQPRHSIFKSLDTVLFLSAGQSIYLGSPVELVPYLASVGFVCEQHENPADFVLDILMRSNGRHSSALQQAFVRSSMHTNACEALRSAPTSSSSSSAVLVRPVSNGSSGFYYVAQRTLCNVIRNPALLASQIISVVIYGLFTALVFHQLDDTVEPGVFNRFGAIFFIISCQILSSLSALEVLISERVLFIHVRLVLELNVGRDTLVVFLGERQRLLSGVELLSRQADGRRASRSHRAVGRLRVDHLLRHGLAAVCRPLRRLSPGESDGETRRVGHVLFRGSEHGNVR